MLAVKLKPVISCCYFKHICSCVTNNNADNIAVFAVLCRFGKFCLYSIHLASTFLRNKTRNKHNSCMILSCMLFRCWSICSRLNGSCDIPALELDNSQSMCSPDAVAECSSVMSLSAVTHLPSLLWLLENCYDLCVVTYTSLIGN